MRHDIQTAVLLLGPISPEQLALLIVGTRICAGFPSPADDLLDGEIDLTRILAPNRAATFLWRVSGHSKKETGIHDGDVVVVDRIRKPRHGDVVVASINGEVSLKLYKNDGRPTIAFANRDMPVFFLADTAHVEVWGTVIWMLHQPRMPRRPAIGRSEARRRYRL